MAVCMYGGIYAFCMYDLRMVVCGEGFFLACLVSLVFSTVMMFQGTMWLASL